MRNSSLVKRSSADNTRDSNIAPKLWARRMSNHARAVEEHSIQRLRHNAEPSGGRRMVTCAGADRKEDVGISNDNPDVKSGHRKSKGS